MHCGSCAVGIQMLLQNTDGITGANIDYDKKSGEVSYDEDKIKTDGIVKAIQELGYNATPTVE